MDEIRDMIAATRTELAAMLGDLSAGEWDAPTLCAGWRVREVVAHITMPFRYSGRRFMLELARSRGDFTAMSDRVARRDASAMSPAELTQAVADNVNHPWKPPGGGFAGALSHDVIHGLDIVVPLGMPWAIPSERLRHVLPESATSRPVRFFGVDLDGIEFVASDMEWTLGSGEPLTGTGQDLLLAICGRKLPQGRLKGVSSDRLTVG
ncbi:MAG TPA: maleylpyruvate isomerase family mycothiol-dependent enzyme [Streptosporangiaceae bacterium]|nr:maleylpyruvate isomerase family mycothiol-dependent enzyme [Streptosporangiaceae bacterium]